MDAALIDRIVENAKGNAIRYWYRTYITNKLFHDPGLIDQVNDSLPHRVHAFLHVREAILDSAVISLARGFLDQGDDSLSLTRLMPSTSEYLRNKASFHRRAIEEEEACCQLYRRWYIRRATDGSYVGIWLRLAENLERFRCSEAVRRVVSMRNAMVAHSLENRRGDRPEYKMLYEIGATLMDLMNDLSALAGGTYFDWRGLVGECESAAIGFQKILSEGYGARV